MPYESGLKAVPFDINKPYNAKVESNNSHLNGEVSKDLVLEALTQVFDPEIPVDIYNLGLIYDFHISVDGDVSVLMTLTSHACPVAEDLPFEVADNIADIKGVRYVGVEITWDVPWNADMMSDEAKLELNLL